MAKTHFVIRAVGCGQVMPILAHECAMFLSGIKKFKKKTKTWFLDILECIGCARGKNSLRDSRGELLSLNAIIGTRGCDVIYQNQKVQKAPKHDFWAYWSVLGAFVAKAHFCQLMPILPHVGALFLTGTKQLRKQKNIIFGHIGVYWVRSWKKLTSWFARRTFVN